MAIERDDQVTAHISLDDLDVALRDASGVVLQRRDRGRGWRGEAARERELEFLPCPSGFMLFSYSGVSETGEPETSLTESVYADGQRDDLGSAWVGQVKVADGVGIDIERECPLASPRERRFEFMEGVTAFEDPYRFGPGPALIDRHERA